MAGTRDGEGGHLFVFPIGPVSVLDAQGQRSTGGQAVGQATGDSNFVSLNLLPPAAAIAHLTAAQLKVDVFLNEGQTSGETLDDRREGGAVGFAGR